ncbi:MAG: hypothetical protein Pg6C_02170 [Treponemataceae bacterium]|nr:MAG: hypothetical protein Pg6C_02170 [Treponemataceae bacterium]
MYGNTKRGLDAVIKGIGAEGVPYTLCRVPNDHVFDILTAAYKSAGIVLAMPTYEYAMFPPMAWTLIQTQAHKRKNRAQNRVVGMVRRRETRIQRASGKPEMDKRRTG